MNVEQNEAAAERTIRQSGQPDAHASISANCWNQMDIHNLNEKQNSGLPIVFGNNFDLIAQAPALETTMPTLAIPPKLDVQAATVARGNDGFELADYRKEIVQGYQNIRHGALPTELPRVAMPAVSDHPFRGSEKPELDKITSQAWSNAYKLFPEFSVAGISEQRIEALAKALVRNELHFYDIFDQLDDTMVKMTGAPIPKFGRSSDAATLGIEQISVKGVRDLVAEFPQVGVYLNNHGYGPGAEKQALEDPQMAPILVAANLAHTARMYQKHGIPINELTLGYGFNPDVSFRRDDKEHGHPLTNKQAEKMKKQGIAVDKVLLPTPDVLEHSQHAKNVQSGLQ
jgi:hypothetical protein